MTPDEQRELMRLCEDIHAMMAETRKGIDDSITILGRIIAAQATWERQMWSKQPKSCP